MEIKNIFFHKYDDEDDVNITFYMDDENLTERSFTMSPSELLTLLEKDEKTKLFFDEHERC